MNNVTIPALVWNILMNRVLNAEKLLKDNPWGPSEAEKVAYNVAKLELRNARNVLRHVLENASWGQNGSAFLRRNAEYIGGPSYPSIYINSRLRAWIDRQGKVQVLQKKYAEQVRNELKQIRRESEAARRELRQRCIDDLLKFSHYNLENFGKWQYIYGMNGGVFALEGDFDKAVSAHGALRGAWGDHWDLEPTETFDVDVTYWEHRLRVS